MMVTSVGRRGVTGILIFFLDICSDNFLKNETNNKAHTLLLFYKKKSLLMRKLIFTTQLQVSEGWEAAGFWGDRAEGDAGFPEPAP